MQNEVIQTMPNSCGDAHKVSTKILGQSDAIKASSVKKICKRPKLMNSDYYSCADGLLAKINSTGAQN